MLIFAEGIEKLLRKVCEFFLWCNFLLIFVIVFQVVARYLFNWTWAGLEELQWHLFSVAMLTGLAYALVEDSHVRADILFEKLSKKYQNVVELLTMLLLVMPFFGFIFYYSLSFVERAHSVAEVSSAPGGLPYRWLIKAVIPLACTLIILAAFAKTLRLISKLRCKDVS